MKINTKKGEKAPSAHLTSKHEGPVILELTQSMGEVTIQVDANILCASVTVRTDDTEGESAKAVRTAHLSQSGDRLHVLVQGGAGGGGTVISGNSVTFSGGISLGGIGGRVIINGVDMTETLKKNAPSEVRTLVSLPPGSEAYISGGSSKVRVKGHLKGLDVSLASGSLAADSVETLVLKTASGSAEVGTVTGRMDATVASGSLDVVSYQGPHGLLTVASGSAHVNADKKATGRFSVNVASGSARLTGASHLDVRKYVSSGSCRVS